MSSGDQGKASRLDILDGWRALSILLVLACHLLPLGPKRWDLNSMAGPMGMALFFTLSGFLITRFLVRGVNVGGFLIRRFFRIVPLAWPAMVVATLMSHGDAQIYVANLFFYANLPPQHLTDPGGHFWSLCLEAQFYLGIALLVGMFGRRSLVVLPFLCLAVTAHRIYMGAHVDIVTWRRGDEILAGCLLALAHEGFFDRREAEKFFSRLNLPVLALLYMAASHPASGALNYARPYLAACLVGVTLFRPAPAYLGFMGSPFMKYIANISFALYVVHHLLMYTWLGSGDTFERYAKRIVLIGLSFLIAHLSTRYYERYFIDAGHRLAERFFPSRPRAARPS